METFITRTEDNEPPRGMPRRFVILDETFTPKRTVSLNGEELGDFIKSLGLIHVDRDIVNDANKRRVFLAHMKMREEITSFGVLVECGNPDELEPSAEASTLQEAEHYAAMYGQDEGVTAVHIEEIKRKVIKTISISKPRGNDDDNS